MGACGPVVLCGTVARNVLGYCCGRCSTVDQAQFIPQTLHNPVELPECVMDPPPCWGFLWATLRAFVTRMTQKIIAGERCIARSTGWAASMGSSQSSSRSNSPSTGFSAVTLRLILPVYSTLPRIPSVDLSPPSPARTLVVHSSVHVPVLYCVCVFLPCRPRPIMYAQLLVSATSSSHQKPSTQQTLVPPQPCTNHHGRHPT